MNQINENRQEELNELRKRKGRFILFFALSNKEKDLEVEVDENTGCWNVVSHLNGNPYPIYRKERLHVLCYKEFKGDIPKGLVIRHTCDNVRCCNPDHLILGTPQDNVNDMFKRDRRPLTFSKEMIQRIANDDSDNYSNLAKKYNTTIYIISNIKNKKIKSFNEYKVNKGRRFKKILEPEEVIEIYNFKGSAKEVAKKYNISESTVYDIRHKRIHKNILNNI